MFQSVTGEHSSLHTKRLFKLGELALVPDAKAATLGPVLKRNISRQVATIYTDEHPIYVFALNRKFRGKHETINHSRTYGIGDRHTNTIENAFSLFKRGMYERTYGTRRSGKPRELAAEPTPWIGGEAEGEKRATPLALILPRNVKRPTCPDPGPRDARGRPG